MQMMLDIKGIQAEKLKLIEDLQHEADKYIKLQTASEAEREKLLCQVTIESLTIRPPIVRRLRPLHPTLPFITVLQRSADVAKLHEDLQIQMDARSAETTKQRQQVLTLELSLEAARVEIDTQQKLVITTKDCAVAEKAQLLNDESTARELVRADLAAKADELTVCQTHLSDAQAQLSATGDETDRLKADLRESADANGILRYAILMTELSTNVADVGM